MGKKKAPGGPASCTNALKPAHLKGLGGGLHEDSVAGVDAPAVREQDVPGDHVRDLISDDGLPDVARNTVVVVEDLVDRGREGLVVDGDDVAGEDLHGELVVVLAPHAEVDVGGVQDEELELPGLVGAELEALLT